MHMNVSEIFESARNDDVLDLDIDDIMINLDTEKNDYLSDKSLKSLMTENREIVSTLCEIKDDKVDTICKSLDVYRFVDEIYDLHIGKHVRWIRKSDPNYGLRFGGIVVDIKFLDLGTHVLIFNRYISKKPIQYKFDDVLTFQKLSNEEQLILFMQSDYK